MGALDQKGRCWSVVAQIKAEISGIPTHPFFEIAEAIPLCQRHYIQVLKIDLRSETLTTHLLSKLQCKKIHKHNTNVINAIII